MRVPISWLKDFVTIDLPISEVDTILTNAGLEVKGIEYIGLPGADLVWDREKVVLGHIRRVEQHPLADRLVLATVDYGGESPEVTVTGAPNLFEFVGQGDITHLGLYAPFALEGATLYDGHKVERKQTKLKGRELRGIYNRCMLCSEKELGISDSHEGIILMRKDEWSPDYRAGTPLQEVLGDAVLEIDIIPNIARCASMVGVAREYAALTGQPMRYPDYDVLMEGEPINGRIQITTANPELNPRFVVLLIEGVQQKPSPYWMQYRLRLAGQRPINVVVDISNYVMLEMGQPNHTFDYDFLRRRADQYAPNGPVHIHTRLPYEGETLTTLDGVKHKLQPYNILVTDPLGNLSLGGVMGGADSEIKPETTNVLLEAAAWNFINIRRTSTQLGIHTDAAFRFSRGVHPSQALLGAKRAAELLRRLAGGRVAQGIVDLYPNPPQPVVVRLDLAYARRLSGLPLSGAEIAELLHRLEFAVIVDETHLTVTVPNHRMDIEGGHDLVEEICRMVGYDRIPTTPLADALPPQRGNNELTQEERIKDILVRAGLQEIISYRLTSPTAEARLYPGGAHLELMQPQAYVTLTNPISPERAVMRQSVLASVLEAVANNGRYQPRIALFELGHVYINTGQAQLPLETPRLALALTGQREVATWQHSEPANYHFFDLKGIMEVLFASLHLSPRYVPAAHPTYRPGRTARILLGDVEIGIMGELHPGVSEAFAIRQEASQPVLAAELWLDVLIPRIPAIFKYQPLSTYPPVHEDLAVVVDAALPATAVVEVMSQAGAPLLKEVELFDVYTGAQVPPGKKSLAYHLTFQSGSKTLSDKEVGKYRQRIIQELQKQLNARLRE